MAVLLAATNIATNTTTNITATIIMALKLCVPWIVSTFPKLYRGVICALWLTGISDRYLWMVDLLCNFAHSYWDKMQFN